MSARSTSVGIDDLALYGSTLSIEAETIAEARGRGAATARRAGLLRRSLAPAFEDPVTLAVNAARPLVDAYGANAFDLLVVATESGVDYAKPVSSYVHRYLGLSEASFHLEMKHACFGATAGLNLASSWVGTRPGARALVVATDMARRLFGDSAEPAEGAGAVAMVVSADPRVLVLDPARAFVSREIYDVMRPDPKLEVIHANLSLAAYLDLLEIAWEGYAAAAGPQAFEALDFLVFHTPVIPLVEQAHRALLDMASSLDGDGARRHFEERVRPSFTYTRETGNLYSGCLYAALAGLVDAAPPSLAGARLGLYSYGSGSGASFFSGTVGAEARAILARHDSGRHLRERRRVSFAEYERTVLENERALTEAHFRPDLDVVPGLFEEAYRGRGRLVLDRVEDYYRVYAWT